jgi:hypothetical protein
MAAFKFPCLACLPRLRAVCVQVPTVVVDFPTYTGPAMAAFKVEACCTASLNGVYCHDREYNGRASYSNANGATVYVDRPVLRSPHALERVRLASLCSCECAAWRVFGCQVPRRCRGGLVRERGRQLRRREPRHS